MLKIYHIELILKICSVSIGILQISNSQFVTLELPKNHPYLLLCITMTNNSHREEGDQAQIAIFILIKIPKYVLAKYIMSVFNLKMKLELNFIFL